MNQKDRAHHTVGGHTSLLIDGFRFHRADRPVSVYVLTHFHSDHYGGLDSGFPWADEGALLYCSEITAALACNVLGVDARHVRALPFGVPTRLLDGLWVTLVPANHCPGAAQLLFELHGSGGGSTGTAATRILHCGDMRFDPSMTRHPALQAAVAAPGGLSEVLLDTTYGHPKHVFANQSDSVEEILAVMRGYVEGGGGEGAAGRASGTAAPPPAKRLKGSGKGALSARGALAADMSGVKDNAKFALSTSDITMRDEAGGSAGRAASETAAHSTLPCDGIPRYATDGKYGRGFVVRHGGGGCESQVVPVQPPSTLQGNMQRRYAHLPPPPSPVHETGDTLFVVSTYATGKERILVGIIRALRLRVYMSPKKLRMAELIGLPEADVSWLTDDGTAAGVHVVGMDACGRSFPYFQPNWAGLERYLAAANARHAAAAAMGGSGGGDGAATATTSLDVREEEEDALFSAGGDAPPRHGVCAPADAGSGGGSSASSVVGGKYTRIVGIVPTGWVHSAKKRVYSSPSGKATVHLVPYSEHSSFPELCAYVAFLRPAKLTPTVYDGEKDAARIRGLFAPFLNQTAAKKTFLSAFTGRGMEEEVHEVGDDCVEGVAEEAVEGDDDVVEVVSEGEAVGKGEALLQPAPAWLCHACGHRGAVVSASSSSSSSSSGAPTPLPLCGACGSGCVERAPPPGGGGTLHANKQAKAREGSPRPQSKGLAAYFRAQSSPPG